MLKKSACGIWLIFPKRDIIGKYLTGWTASRYANNMHPTRFSNVPLLPLRNSIGWGNYGTRPVFTPCVSRNYPKTWGKNGTSIFTIFCETNSH